MHTTTIKTLAILGVAVALLAILVTVGLGLRAQESFDAVAPPCCDTAEPPDGAPPGEPGTGEQPPDDPFADADERMDQMVDTQANWHAPSQTPVEETTEIGLSIGDGEQLRQEVEEVLPEVPTQSSVPLRVGSDVSARLIGDPSDVSITPDDAINASTGSDIALLWTWHIHPRHPADRLRLTAVVTMMVPGTSHQFTKILQVQMRVTRTIGFTAHQVFTNWGTWTAIVTAFAGAAGWTWRRTRRKKWVPADRHAPASASPPPDPPDAMPEPSRPPSRRMPRSNSR